MHSAVDSILTSSGGDLLPFDRPAYEQAETISRARLGSEQFEAAHDAGSLMAVEDLLTEAEAILTAATAAAQEPRRRGTATPFRLTARESEVLRLVAEGKTDREIAESLIVSRRTVNAHVASIRSQLGVHSRQAAVDRARALGLLSAAIGDRS